MAKRISPKPAAARRSDARETIQPYLPSPEARTKTIVATPAIRAISPRASASTKDAGKLGRRRSELEAPANQRMAIAAAQCAHDRRAALMARQGAVTHSDLIGAALSVACSPYQRGEARQP